MIFFLCQKSSKLAGQDSLEDCVGEKEDGTFSVAKDGT
jgi:hypothetical protein